MAQIDIYSFLLKNRGKWFNTKDISEELKINRCSVAANLKKLKGYESGLEVREFSPKKGGFHWRLK